MTFYVADRFTRGIEPGDVYAYPDGDRDESLIAWAESMGIHCMSYARTSIMDRKLEPRHVSVEEVRGHINMALRCGWRAADLILIAPEIPWYMTTRYPSVIVGVGLVCMEKASVLALYERVDFQTKRFGQPVRVIE